MNNDHRERERTSTKEEKKEDQRSTRVNRKSAEPSKWKNYLSKNQCDLETKERCSSTSLGIVLEWRRTSATERRERYSLFDRRRNWQMIMRKFAFKLGDRVEIMNFVIKFFAKKWTWKGDDGAQPSRGMNNVNWTKIFSKTKTEGNQSKTSLLPRGKSTGS